MSTLALQEQKETTITPMTLVQQAVLSGDVPVEKLEKLLELQQRWEADQARKAFVQAMADFKAEAIVVTKDRENKQYNSRYTSIDNLVNTVTPFLSKHGLSAAWKIDQGGGIKVTCIITHRLGHEEPTSMQVPLDTSGAKNPIQQIKSSITYARILTFESACGLASQEANLNDDGNGATSQPKGELSLDAFEQFKIGIETAETLDDLKSRYSLAYKAAEKAGDKPALNQFRRAKDQRKEEIEHGN